MAGRRDAGRGGAIGVAPSSLGEPTADADARVRGERRAIVADPGRHIAGPFGELTEPSFALSAREPRRWHSDAEPVRLLHEGEAGGPQLTAGIRGAERQALAGDRREQAAQLQRQVQR